MAKNKNEVFIASACRTPIGNFGGALKDYSAVDLGAIAIRNAIIKSLLLRYCGNSPETRVIMGNVLSAGLGQNPAKQAAIKSEVPHSKIFRCSTINKVCGSGLQAVINGYDLIRSGRGHIVIAGGMESMSNTPYVTPRPYIKKDNKPARLCTGDFFHKKAVQLTIRGEMLYDGKTKDFLLFTDSMIHDGLQDAYNYKHMGEIANHCAIICDILRDKQDGFAIESNRCAIKATLNGFFRNEIVAVGGVRKDEGIKKFDSGKMKAMKPVFGETITAGNASKLSDGAAALVLLSSGLAGREGLTLLAKIVDASEASIDPNYFPEAPYYAIYDLLKKNGLKIDDIDLWEINEAFASVPIYSMEMLKIPREKVNVHGGAVALGHPIGASGARILVTLVHAMKRYNKKRGVAAICIGGGEALAVLVELV